jgi:hypothetical protein
MRLTEKRNRVRVRVCERRITVRGEKEIAKRKEEVPICEKNGERKGRWERRRRRADEVMRDTERRGIGEELRRIHFRGKQEQTTTLTQLKPP